VTREIQCYIVARSQGDVLTFCDNLKLWVKCLSDVKHFWFYFQLFFVVLNDASVKHKQQLLTRLYALVKYAFRYGSKVI